MKQRPILFSTPMVQAILAGNKTQTRRTITPHRSGPCETALKRDLDWNTIYPNNPHGIKLPHKSNDPWHKHTVHRVWPLYEEGDQLWVRETTFFDEEKYLSLPLPVAREEVYYYKADGHELKPGQKWTPSIFMRKQASRITLDITDVRVERLQDISNNDAWCEGVSQSPEYNCVAYFKKAWEKINGLASWVENPWVWVIQFKKIEP